MYVSNQMGQSEFTTLTLLKVKNRLYSDIWSFLYRRQVPVMPQLFS